MWLTQVLAHQVASILFVLDNVCLPNNFDASTAAHIGWFENVHMLEV